MGKKDIPAIETWYRNFHFRSKTEAQWAIFFDLMQIKWEYEPENMKLSNGECYLPDFYLPDIDTYVEIKHKGEFDVWSIDSSESFRKYRYAIYDITDAGHLFLLLMGRPWEIFSGVFSKEHGYYHEGESYLWVRGECGGHLVALVNEEIQGSCGVKCNDCDHFFENTLMELEPMAFYKNKIIVKNNLTEGIIPYRMDKIIAPWVNDENGKCVPDPNSELKDDPVLVGSIISFSEYVKHVRFDRGQTPEYADLLDDRDKILARLRSHPDLAVRR